MRNRDNGCRAMTNKTLSFIFFSETNEAHNHHQRQIRQDHTDKLKGCTVGNTCSNCILHNVKFINIGEVTDYRINSNAA